jgi:hypothetical protein
MAVISLKQKTKLGTLASPGDVDPGAMIPLSTVSVGAGGVSSVVFSNIPQVYQDLQIRFVFRGTIADVNCDMFCWFNGDTAQANYGRTYLRGNGTAASAGIVAPSTAPVAGTGTGSTASASLFGAGILDIFDYSNGNKKKNTRSWSGEERGSAGNIWLFSTYYTLDTAITSITLVPQSNSFAEYSHFALYGIKKAGA